ncbi:hypothetical protein K9M74_05055 [Candidatus Woesearchaeota archaeon]|nr:hypothetical protein [Candidatus Woesearchaeota archaeon]
MVTKKSTTKKVSSKAQANKKTSGSQNVGKQKKTKRVVKKKITHAIPQEQYFVLMNGERLGHYMQLADVLEELEDAVVAHHVNEVRHDFANWVRHVFNEEDLAKELEDVDDKKAMRFIIYKHLVKKHLN